MTTPLIFSEDDWSSLPSLLEDPCFKNLHKQNEESVNRILDVSRDTIWNLPADLRDTSHPDTSPTRYRIFRHRLYRFAVSWRLTGREDSLREALRTVDLMMDPGERHTVVEYGGVDYGDLRTADLWVNACFALEALAPVLGDERKAGLVSYLKDWALPAYLKGIEEGDWWRRCDFNWGASLHGAAGMAALCLGDEVPELSKQVLEEVRDGLRFVVSNFPQEGGWTEGLMYQTTTLGHLTDFLAALVHVTGEDWGLLNHPRIHANLSARPWMIGGDGHPLNFSNINERSDEWRLPHAWWWAEKCRRPDWAGFEEKFPRCGHDTKGIFLPLEMFWFRKPFQKSSPWKPETGLWHSRDLDWLSWRRGNSWLGFRSGFNGGNHNNRDLGQIIFGRGEERVLVDPGYGHSATSQHNCVQLKGDQAIGSQAGLFRVEEFDPNGVRLLYLCCDLKNPYASQLDFHYRHVLADSRGMLVVFDDIRANRGLRLGATGHLQFNREPSVCPGGDIRLADSPNNIRIRFFTENKISNGDSWPVMGYDVYTLRYQSPCDAVIFRQGFVVTPENTANPEVTLNAVDNHLIIPCGKYNAVISLDEGFCRVR